MDLTFLGSTACFSNGKVVPVKGAKEKGKEEQWSSEEIWGRQNYLSLGVIINRQAATGIGFPPPLGLAINRRHFINLTKHFIFLCHQRVINATEFDNTDVKHYVL